MDSLFARCFAVIIMSCLFTLKSHALANEQFLVVQHCLLSEKFQYQELAKAKYLRLIKTTKIHDLQMARNGADARCKGFVNVTDAWQAYSKQKKPDPSGFLRNYLPSMRPSDFTRSNKVQYQNQINPLLQTIDTKQMQKDLLILTNFQDRYVNSEDGVRAAGWVKKQVEEMIAKYSRTDVSIFSISTLNGAKQPSVIVKIGKNLPGSAIVIGAHLDTIDSSDESQPGADDNASGVVTLLETARVLFSQHVILKNPVYLIWYAGEEEGKLGSQSVVRYFNQNKIAVDAVLELDATGFVGNERGIGLADDLTDAGLSAFVADLVAKYLGQPASAVRCGYACSDHVIWYQNGNRVAYPLETMDETRNPYVHRRKDTLDKLSLDHIADFAKLSIAFAVELGEPEVTVPQKT